MKSSRVLFAVCFVLCTAAVAGIVVLAALTSWWLLFALFAVPPLLMLVFGATMMTTRGPLARLCTDAPCAPWLKDDIARTAALP